MNGDNTFCIEYPIYYENFEIYKDKNKIPAKIVFLFFCNEIYKKNYFVFYNIVK